LQIKVNASEALNIQTPRKSYVTGTDKLRPLQKKVNKPAELTQLLQFISDDEKTIQWNMRQINYLPTDLFRMQVDSSAIVNSGIDISKLGVKYAPEIVWQYSKSFYGHNDVILLDIIANNLASRPICFAVNGRTDQMIGLDRYLVHHGLVEQLLPVVPDSSRMNPKIVDTEFMTTYLMDSLRFSLLQSENGMTDYENEIISRDVLRKNYYFLGQALLEEGDTAKAISVVEKAEEMLPDSLVEYRQYAYSFGKLYHRAGEIDKSKQVMSRCIQNLENEIRWYVSVNPTYPIMNVRHMDDVMEMYAQMVEQIETYHEDLANEKAETLETLTNDYKAWRTVNWPY